VRYLKAEDQHTAWTHMALRVSLPDGTRYLADVGFSGINSIAPIQMDRTDMQVLPEGHFRLTGDTTGHYTLERQLAGDKLRALYLFKDEAASEPDLVAMNWYSCTFPEARFTSSFFASRVVGDTRRHILNGAYVVRQSDGAAETTPIVDKAHLMQLLDSVFGLVPANDEGLERYL
jgi:N-hydroxyarylamine O-acetyltransferase